MKERGRFESKRGAIIVVYQNDKILVDYNYIDEDNNGKMFVYHCPYCGEEMRILFNEIKKRVGAVEKSGKALTDCGNRLCRKEVSVYVNLREVLGTPLEKLAARLQTGSHNDEDDVPF